METFCTGMNAYIETCKGMQLKMDCQAIKIMRKQVADQWIPLNQIKQLYLYGYADVHFSVITSCLQRGVNIHFFDHHKHYLGALVSNHFSLPDQMSMLEDILMDPSLEKKLIAYLQAGLQQWCQNGDPIKKNLRQVSPKIIKHIQSWFRSEVTAELVRMGPGKALPHSVYTKCLDILAKLALYQSLSAIKPVKNRYPLSQKMIIIKLEHNQKVREQIRSVIFHFNRYVEKLYYHA